MRMFSLPVAYLLAVFVIEACRGQRSTTSTGAAYCYSNDSDPYVMFSTKTAYEFVDNNDSTEWRYQDCSPVQFWMISRHGIRYPGQDDINQMQDLYKLRDEIVRAYKERKGSMCDFDIKLIQNWTLNVNASEADTLTKNGFEELYFLAKRYRSRLPSLLQRPYDPQLFQFRHTDSERTKRSAEAFSLGLFDNVAVHIPPGIPNDQLIGYHTNCTKWNAAKRSNPELKRERQSFETGSIFQSVIRDVSSRLGFTYSLPAATVKLAYAMCRYDKAWDLRHYSPWCSLFNAEQLKVLEYSYDLKYYYENGYGTPYNLNMGYPIVQDFLTKFRETQTNSGQNMPQGVFYFTHSAIIQLLLTTMGIGKDYVPPASDNYLAMGDRKWRTSTLSPFSSNLAAVLLNCGDRFRVQFYLQEQPVQNLCDLGYCSLHELESLFGDGATRYKTESLCDPNLGVTTGPWAHLTIAALVLTFVRQTCNFL